MSSNMPEDRFAEKLDRLLFENELDNAGDDAALLELAAELDKMMPAVQARPEFRSNLRSELVQLATETERKPARLVPVREQAVPRPGFFDWLQGRRFVMASALSVVIIAVVGVFAFQYFQPWNTGGQPTVIAQNNAGTPTAAASGSAAAATPEVSIASSPETSAAAAATAAQQVAELAPLPTINPLSQMPVLGMGGGGGAGGPGWPTGPLPVISFPASIISQYDLQSSLSTDVPAEANVYQLGTIRVPEEAARDLAGRLGFTTEPVIEEVPSGIEPDAPLQTSYFWEDGVRNLSVVPATGMFVYNEQQGMPDIGAMPSVVSSEEQAIQIATQALESKGLVLNGMTAQSAFGVGPATTPDGGPADPIGWRVHFGQDAGGLMVFGAYEDVTINSAGQLVTVEVKSREVLDGTVYPLRTVDKAWADVQAGKALWVESSPMPDLQPGETRTAQITGVAVVYSEKLPGQTQDVLQPLYRFSGTVTAPDGTKYEVAVYVPAVADEFYGAK